MRRSRSTSKLAPRAIGTGKISPLTVESIVKGLSIACKENGCALIGGEIAEMPGLYQKGEYDLASFIVGKVKEKDIIDGSSIKKGDRVIGISSSGLHTNGYSLALKVLLEKEKLSLSRKAKGLSVTLGEELLKVHRSYLEPISKLSEHIAIKGMAHITGGGLVENVPRILPESTAVKIDKGSWDVPPIFSLIQGSGNIDEKEMYRVFNMGIGFVIIVDQKDSKKTLEILKGYPYGSHVIGEVIEGKKEVIL